jgi:beta-galactosidase
MRQPFKKVSGSEFVNGKSWGVKSFAFAHYGFDQSKGWAEQAFAPPVRATTADLHLAWDVVYQPGTLRAVGKKEGEVVCEQEIVTAGEPARIELTADRETIAADGRDVVHVTARILDAAGNSVPAADALITFEVEGEGRIIGVDNGDPASHESFQADHRKAFNGLCLAIVQATKTPGTVRVEASVPGMTPGSVVSKTR